MIPVEQTRTSTREHGNCFEACIASILELPLTAIPDRRDYIDTDTWRKMVDDAFAAGGTKAIGDLDLPAGLDDYYADLDLWLRERGLTTIRWETGFDRAFWRLIETLDGYWIASHRIRVADTAHAVVRKGREFVWNPMPSLVGGEMLDELIMAEIFVAVDPARVARRLNPLPDVRGVSAKLLEDGAIIVSGLPAG